jgi:hypothetical protein
MIENIHENENNSFPAYRSVSVNKAKRRLNRQRRRNLIVPKKQQKP